QREIQAGVLHEQSSANGPRNVFVRGRQPGPASPAILRSGSVPGKWSLLQLSAFRLGRSRGPAGRGDARGEPGPALRRRLSADTGRVLLPKLTAGEVV